jgi:hypothetical protein
MKIYKPWRNKPAFCINLIDIRIGHFPLIDFLNDTINHQDTDKRAAIDAIKKRFYDDLHHRMELFFTTRHA